MTEFVKLGGVGVLGYISPIDTDDTYPVIDPLYGIDGFRNVDTEEDLIAIPFERRRSGMIVGIDGGDRYFKLKNIEWVGDINDWKEVYILDTNPSNLNSLFVDKEIPMGIIDGNNTMYYLSNIPISNSEHIYINGLLQENDYDYTIEENEIIFFEAPLSGMRIVCSYRY